MSLGINPCLLTERFARMIKKQVASYIQARVEKIYFCGYKLSEIYLQRFFLRYQRFIGHGLCGAIAGMSMLALKYNKTARYVYAFIDKGHYRHCWVEFRYLGIWWVIDPSWLESVLCLRRAYYISVKPEVIETCSYQRFWGYPISQQLYEKLQSPETSWLLSELMCTYGFDERRTEQLFNPRIQEERLGEKDGRRLDLWLFYADPDIIFSRRIMHQMMLRPERKRPQAHTIRQVKHFQRSVKKAYEQWLREHPEEIQEASA